MFSFSVIETDMNGCIGEEVSFLVNVIIRAVEEIRTNKGKQLQKYVELHRFEWWKK